VGRAVDLVGAAGSRKVFDRAMVPLRVRQEKARRVLHREAPMDRAVLVLRVVGVVAHRVKVA
jgi:hypothetical protein